MVNGCRIRKGNNMVKIIRKVSPKPESNTSSYINTALKLASAFSPSGPSFEDNQPFQSSFHDPVRGLSQLGQGALEGGASLLGLPGSLYNLGRAGVGGIASLFGSENPLPENNAVPTSSDLQGGVSNILKQLIPESHFKPQGFREEFARELGSLLPSAAATIGSGGAAAPALARTAGAALGGTVGDKISGPIGGLVGNIAGGIAGKKGLDLFNSKEGVLDWFTGGLKKGVDPRTLQGIAQEAEKELFEKEKLLGSKINAPVPRYKSELEKIKKSVEDNRVLPKTEQKDLLGIINKFLSDIKGGDEINASTLSEGNRQINSIFGKGKEKTYQNTIKWLQKTVKGGLEEVSKTGKDAKEWHNTLNKANNVTQALHYNDYLKDMASNSKLGGLVTSPLARSILGLAGGGYLGGALGSGIGAAVSYFGGKVLGKGIEKGSQIAGFLKYPGARSLLADAFKYTIDRNVPALAKAWKAINTKAGAYEKKHPEIKPLKIIRKGNA